MRTTDTNDSQRQESVFRLFYFDAPTRGEQIRLLFHLTGTPFEDKRVSPFPRGLNRFKQSAMGDASPLAFDQVPCVQHGEVAIVQTPACMQYVGAKVGLEPEDAAGRARAMMITLGAEEMRNQVFYRVFFTLIAEAVKKKTKLPLGPLVSGIRAYCRWRRRKKFTRWCERFEALLRNSGGEMFVGDAMSYADVAVFECFAAIEDTGCFRVADAGASFPKLVAFMNHMRGIPRLKSYLEERGPVALGG